MSSHLLAFRKVLSSANSSGYPNVMRRLTLQASKETKMKEHECNTINATALYGKMGRSLQTKVPQKMAFMRYQTKPICRKARSPAVVSPCRPVVKTKLLPVAQPCGESYLPKTGEGHSRQHSNEWSSYVCGNIVWQHTSSIPQKSASDTDIEQSSESTFSYAAATSSFQTCTVSGLLALACSINGAAAIE